MTASRADRITQAALLLAGFSVGLCIAFIVFRGLVQDLGVVGEIVKEQRAEAGRWRRQALGDYQSDPGEALPDFLRQVGQISVGVDNREQATRALHLHRCRWLRKQEKRSPRFPGHPRTLRVGQALFDGFLSIA